jgi:hypothetical protein
MRPLFVLALFGLLFAASDADAGKKKSKKYKYHFEVFVVKAAEGVEGELAADALKLLDAEARKQFAAHPQLVADTSAAPDPNTDPKGYSKWLKKKKLRGSYSVTIDLTSYREEIEDSPKEDGTKRVVVRLELHMFGEHIPHKKLGFEGNGGATVKIDVGKKVRPKDREYAIQEAIQLAVADAIVESLTKLAEPPAKPSKK